MINFKFVTPDDYALIQKIASITWPVTFRNLISDDQIEYMLGEIYNKNSIHLQITNQGHTFLVVEKVGNPVGFASYELDHGDKPVLMIHKLYILPEFQSMGIGCQVIEYLTKIALQNQNFQLTLKVLHNNTRAIMFYQHLGFIQTGSVTTILNEQYKIVDLIMTKKLILR